MIRRFPLFVVAILMFAVLPVSEGQSSDEVPHPTPPCSANRDAWTVGLVYCNANATLGYTLFAPIPSNTTYLIDHEGRMIHSWASPGGHQPALSAYLLPDGDLLRTANTEDTAVGNFSGGGTGGKLERISWDGTLEWSWEYSSTTYISHHDIEPMPNGNILMIAWEERTEAEALQAGRNPAIASDSPGGQNNIWPDHIVEIQPVGNDSATVVWAWYAWDHLVQDYDPTKDNYGVVEEHPELININYAGGTGNQAGRADWMHCNGIDYNPTLDQIAVSCRGMHEVFIIDHSTTTEEAAGHSGGNSGKGGDLLYRWGNPQVYGKGLSSDQQLFGQHDVQWVEEGHPYSGSLSIYNNGNGRSTLYSSVDIITPRIDNDSYVLEENGTFGPSLPNYSWNQGEAMYSRAISGVQTMSNGHMLVTHGTYGTLYEVDEHGEVVWTYINPILADGPLEQGISVPAGNRALTTANQIFKATHISLDHPAFVGKLLITGSYLEEWNDACPEQDAWGWDKDGDGCIDDSDGDGVTDPMDICPFGSDEIDVDQDGTPDACDSLVDSDGDGVSDSSDACEGHDDAVDVDADGIPEPCDALVDSDGDGVADETDACEGYDDAVDADGDGHPEPCDTLVDSDGDGVADELDVCPDHDDLLDEDDDGVPNGCDETPIDHPDENNTTVEDDSNTSGSTNVADASSSTSGRAAAVLIAIGVGIMILRSRRP